MIPIHKKGNTSDLSNYRPISCLPAASKILEKVVLTQLEKFVEENDLLPKQQHGFRANRSTETCLASMVAEWSKQYDEKRDTGILLWDLSSAFDTIDADILCRKLQLYGLSELSIGWFRSYLTNRCQQVQIGHAVSEPATVSIGCPQGALLSPLLFILYVADLELWVKNVKIHGYADDFTTSFSSCNEKEVFDKLEADAEMVLRYMASNHLSANAKKTGFMVIRNSSKQHVAGVVKVGDAVIEEKESHSILGLTVNNVLTWSDHVNGLLPAIRHRVGTLRRLAYYIPSSYLAQIASAIIGAKIRYGIGIYGAVRKNISEPVPDTNRELQVALNNAMRIAAGVRLSDKVRIEDLFQRTGIQSVNRMSAQNKLMLAWQGLKVPGSPLYDFLSGDQNRSGLRSKERGDICTSSKTSLGQRNFPETAIRLWNQTPQEFRMAEKKNSAKSTCKRFIENLPLL